jgi:hypothetical protein
MTIMFHIVARLFRTFPAKLAAKFSKCRVKNNFLNIFHSKRQIKKYRNYKLLRSFSSKWLYKYFSGLSLWFYGLQFLRQWNIFRGLFRDVRPKTRTSGNSVSQKHFWLCDIFLCFLNTGTVYRKLRTCKKFLFLSN